MGKSELNYTNNNNNKDNNSNNANSPPPMYFKGSGPINLNGGGGGGGAAMNGQSDYAVDQNNIPMRPLMLSQSVNHGSGRNMPGYGVATRGGGSYLLQPPGELKNEIKVEN